MAPESEHNVDHTLEARPQPRTLAELRASGWRPRTVKEELRANLLTRLASGAQVFPGVVGYEDSVVPAIENAILAGHDLVFLGERGQAKTRMARMLVDLLDPWLPIVHGGELNDDPFAPVSPAARAIVERDGDATPIDWLPRDRRYAEKLATPDITIADLIGEVDPIKVAEGRYLSDELTLHYGLIPRANRGIVAINELPDLAERIQVGLLNILEERDVQIRGFVVRLPLDLYMVASANPEDYTSRGRIITPLKDRLGSQIRTHYPRTLDHEMAIVRQEKHRFSVEDGAPAIVMPAFMEELVAELTHLARRSPEISQRSGVSVRVSVANTEVLEAAALKRAVRLGEPVAAPRVSDLGAVVASTVGKVELESVGDDAPEERIVERLITKALHTTFSRHVSVDDLDGVVDAFEDGFTVETGDRTPSRVYVMWMREVPGLEASVRRLGAFDVTDGAEEPAVVASAVEFLLEGLHLARRLNKDRIGQDDYHRAAGRATWWHGPDRRRDEASRVDDDLLPGSARSGAGRFTRGAAPAPRRVGGGRARPCRAVLRLGWHPAHGRPRCRRDPRRTRRRRHGRG
jgi:magnesium chelatase subunit I